MTGKSEYTLILFYSHTNEQSMRARVSLSEFVSEDYDWVDVQVEEVYAL